MAQAQSPEKGMSNRFQAQARVFPAVPRRLSSIRTERKVPSVRNAERCVARTKPKAVEKVKAEKSAASDDKHKEDRLDHAKSRSDWGGKRGGNDRSQARNSGIGADQACRMAATLKKNAEQRDAQADSCANRADCSYGRCERTPVHLALCWPAARFLRDKIGGLNFLIHGVQITSRTKRPCRLQYCTTGKVAGSSKSASVRSACASFRIAWVI